MRFFVLLVCSLFSEFASAQVLAPASPAGVVLSQNQAGFFPPGQIGYYRFSEGGGLTTVDNSGQGNTGTLSGSSISFGPGRFGSGLSNTASALSYVNTGPSIGAAIASANSCSVAAWVFATTPSNTAAVTGSSAVNGCEVRANSYNGIDIVQENTKEVCISNTNVPLNKWTHVAATVSPSGCAIYVNGIAVGITTFNSYTFAASNQYLGNRGAALSEPFIGLLDEIRICACVWPPSVIAQIYNYVGP